MGDNVGVHGIGNLDSALVAEKEDWLIDVVVKGDFTRLEMLDMLMNDRTVCLLWDTG